MRNTFLVFRLVLLGLFFNFALLSLIFAAWNVNASIAVGIPTSSASIFIIFQSCLVFFGVTLALADIFHPEARMSRTTVECTWVGVLAIFQMGGAIGAVIASKGSACSIDADHNICVSASLLIPTAWLSALLFMTYFLALFIATITHKGIYPDIWQRTVYSVQWFESPRAAPPREKGALDSYTGSVFDDKDVYAAFYHDPEAHRPKYREEPAPWATSPGRRGIDPPFARKPHGTSPASSPTIAIPDRSADPSLSPGGGARSIEKFREANVLARAEGAAEFTRHQHTRTGSFPLSVLDLDQPIPLTRLSEWVRATDLADARRSEGGSGALFSQ
ncbi:hypothetical protein HYPSUDRAFT_35474 [Hypholoma sublateritium FD-334 SS-4]|uniref:Uncharacterized protein n=1 Tax=Hypholoma sublateritium (strain FD-334 SS-4) TaxID=945553 RepID=A0A0D2LIT6_HYPSF|nr:hypothetical protein HYPSUDRAFT_35474 [Hypholoma sublateritium FD-334 SS-4]